MILKELYITEQIRCPFHDGLNIILGSNQKQDQKESKKISDANGVGKTRIIKCLLHVLGGDTGGAFDTSFFTKKAYWASLHITSNTQDYVISRPLWKPFSDQVVLIFKGSLQDQDAYFETKKVRLSNIREIGEVNRYCGESNLFKVLIKTEAKRYISRLEGIDYSEGNLSFSNLLDYLIRDEMLGFNHTVSRQVRTEWVQHRCIQYLFGLPATIEQRSDELKQKAVSIAQEVASIKEYLKENGIKNISTIQNRKVQLRKKLERTQKNVAAYKVKDTIESVRKQYANTRSSLVNLNAELNNKEAQIRSHKKNLSDIDNKADSIKNLLDTEAFYNEILDFFPEQIADNFEEYNVFFSSISGDRRSYYEELIQDLGFEIKDLKSQKKALTKELDELTKSLSDTNIIGDLSSLAKEEESIKNNIKELDSAERKFTESENLEIKRAKLVEKRQALIKQGKDLEKKNRKKREALIELFQSLVTDIYSTEDAVLDFEYNENLQSSTAGRTEVLCSIPSQQSKGRTHAKICIFDYVWFLRNRTKSEYQPEFLVHDGPFSSISPEPKKRMLKRIAAETLKNKKQYIITANDVELPDLEDFENHVCIKLDGSKDAGKFFGEQYE